MSRINPRIIQCSVTGFGTAGAYKDYPALDIIIQAISGHMAITGEPGRPPVRVGIPLADLSGGIFSCKGILAALYARERTGQGQRVELSMFDSMLNLLSYMGTMWLTNGELPQPPTTYLRRNVYFDTVVFTPHQLEALVKTYGAERIVLGTDYPFDMLEYDPIGHVASVESFDDATRAALCGGNAKKLLGL